MVGDVDGEVGAMSSGVAAYDGDTANHGADRRAGRHPGPRRRRRCPSAAGVTQRNINSRIGIAVRLRTSPTASRYPASDGGQRRRQKMRSRSPVPGCAPLHETHNKKVPSTISEGARPFAHEETTHRAHGRSSRRMPRQRSNKERERSRLPALQWPMSEHPSRAFLAAPGQLFS